MTGNSQNRSESGFTQIEFMICTMFLLVILGLFFCGCTQKIKEAYFKEVRENLKVIQTALEKYAVDNNGSYPQFILGGDLKGWDTCEGCETIVARPGFASNLKQTNLKGGGARPPKDPLINGGYLESYPQNPLLKHFGDKAPSLSGGVPGQPGSGDVRFGYSGLVMGNGLDDPRYLWGKYPVFDQPEKIRIQPTRLVNTMSQAAFLRHFASIHPNNTVNPFYSFGGIPDSLTQNKIMNWWWPGQFFYRSSGEMQILTDINPDDPGESTVLTIWDFEIIKIDRYILGAYFDTATEGIDLIRNTTLEGSKIDNRSGMIRDKYRRSSSSPYPESTTVYMSPPEVFGGGDEGLAPFFPYLDSDGNFIYGAPDGYPDGIMEPVYIDNNRILTDL